MNHEQLKGITQTEYEDRLVKLKRSMREKNIDAVLLTDEKNIRWACGFWVLITEDGWSPTALVVPRSDAIEPVLVMGAEATGESMSQVSRIAYWEDGLHPDLTAQKGSVLAELLQELHLERGTVGFELGHGMRMALEQNDVDLLRRQLPHLQAADFSLDLWRLRSIKSRSEIEKIRRATEITCDSFRSGFETIREGITERELAQFFQAYWFGHGATGISHAMVGFGRHAVENIHCIPSRKPLSAGEVACIDLGCSFEGYRTDIYRLACVGEPSDEEARLAKLILEANQCMREAIRPGRKFAEIYAVAARVFEDAGLLHLMPSAIIGHSIGLGIHEWPFIARDEDVQIQAGMVLAVEPWTLDYRDRSLGLHG